jgi:hypothetical protein
MCLVASTVYAARPQPTNFAPWDRGCVSKAHVVRATSTILAHAPRPPSVALSFDLEADDARIPGERSRARACCSRMKSASKITTARRTSSAQSTGNESGIAPRPALWHSRGLQWERTCAEVSKLRITRGSRSSAASPVRLLRRPVTSGGRKWYNQLGAALLERHESGVISIGWPPTLANRDQGYGVSVRGKTYGEEPCA